jgi:hypothetical protein
VNLSPIAIRIEALAATVQANFEMGEASISLPNTPFVPSFEAENIGESTAPNREQNNKLKAPR